MPLSEETKAELREVLESQIATYEKLVAETMDELERKKQYLELQNKRLIDLRTRLGAL